MKGVVFDLQKFALHDGPGIRTAVFLKGCELCCEWCCNPESQLPAPQLAFEATKCTHCLECVSSCRHEALQVQDNLLKVNFEKCTGCGDCIKECAYGALKIYGYTAEAEDIVAEVLKDKDYFENSGGGLTLTGGDPVFQHAFAYEILRLAKEKGLHTCVETSGYCRQEIIARLAGVTDLFLYDFKHHLARGYHGHTGVSGEAVMSNLDFLCREKHEVVLRCPVIPGVNNTLQHFQAIADLSNRYESITGVEIMPFHDWGFHKYEMLGRKRPVLGGSTVPKETKQQWIAALLKLGCTKIKTA